MGKAKICVMCRSKADYIDMKTNEPLCESCTRINEGIYHDKGKAGGYKRC